MEQGCRCLMVRVACFCFFAFSSIMFTSCIHYPYPLDTKTECGDRETIPYGKIDSCGCITPPRAIFEKYPVKFGLGDLKIGKINAASLTFDTSPYVVKVASDTSIDQQILEYSACRTARQYCYNQLQRAWQEKLISLLLTRPTPDQINQFYRENFFPDGPQQQSTASLLANPNSIERGQSAVLTWQTNNVTRVMIDGLSAGLTGRRTVSPSETKTYSLIASGDCGSTEMTATIAVHTPPLDLKSARVFFFYNG